MLPALGTRNERVLVTADLTLGGSSVREGVPAELGPATDRAIPIASTKPSEPLRRIEDGRQRLRSMFPSPARARRDGRHHTARKRRPGSEGRVDPGGKSAGTHPSRSRRRSQPTASRNIKARSRSCRGMGARLRHDSRGLPWIADRRLVSHSSLDRAGILRLRPSASRRPLLGGSDRFYGHGHMWKESTGPTPSGFEIQTSFALARPS